MAPIPVLTPEQAAAWDRSAEQTGISSATLMESAGRAVVQVMMTRYRDRVRQGVLVACGAGNNGGDGWVVARTLHRLGVSVWVAAVPSARPSALCDRMAGLARADGVREVAPDGPWPAVGLLVDAILGTGARGAPHGGAAALMERLADLALPLVAVDGPTGLDLLDGVQHGPLRAALTVTFGGYRRGHLLARDEVGDTVAADIGFPEPDPAWPVLLTDATARSMVPPLRAAAHKGERGRIVIVGGSPGMTGAARI
ncbi:MAG: NAD(P)H-hydrate epimerase, partial [Gemmatimonadota bacterium]|nr:NAD(P)H-hydrate epimerase [Gemmatimonadota bacterium]